MLRHQYIAMACSSVLLMSISSAMAGQPIQPANSQMPAEYEFKSDSSDVDDSMSSDTSGNNTLIVADPNSTVVVNNNYTPPTVGYFQFAPAIGLEGFSEKYIKEAETYGSCNLVRVSDSYDMSASLWFMGQYVGQDLARSMKNSHVAPGIYFGVKGIDTNGEVFDGFSTGLSIVWFRDGLSDSREEAEDGSLLPSDAPRDSTKWFQTINLSAGPVWHRTQTLADGIEEGRPLPSTYDEIKYKTEDEIGWVFMVSGSL